MAGSGSGPGSGSSLDEIDLTGTMGGEPSQRGSGGGASHEAGLVLAYAAEHASIPSVILLGNAGVVLGREQPPGGGGVVLPQRAVSRLHAKVSPSGGGWVISDLGSRNGIIVNGSRVAQAMLANGDLVRVGDTIFKFVAEDAAAYAGLALDAAGPHADAGVVGGIAVARMFGEALRVAKTDLTILIRGETGTGKEVIARAIHARSGRKGKLCALNCAAIPANLVESELFGAKRGAYTGADRDRPGIVATARGGTLLLDEIGDMPLDAQAKLLRMLETKEIVPVGAAEPEKVDVRVVCATHRDLPALVAADAFRGDLLARINVFGVVLPRLRDRKEDIYRLVRSFLAKHGRPEVTCSLRFMVAALDYDWPYNVRELEAAVRRALAVAEGPELDSKHLPAEIADRLKSYGTDERRAVGANAVTAANAANAANVATAANAPKGSERASNPGSAGSSSALTTAPSAPSAEQLRALLEEHGGNVAAVGRVLGKDRQQIHRWMRQHGIKPDAFRP